MNYNFQNFATKLHPIILRRNHRTSSEEVRG